METIETKNLERLKKLSAQYFRTIKPFPDKKGLFTAQIKLSNYSELGCIITETLKLCIVALDQDAHKTSDTVKTSPINVSLILEMVLELIPTDEFEILDEIHQMFVGDN
ncbi:hypothetical protein [Flavobacterium pectinovorum]|uniref:Uncharacterized protein n=1 Tax=Flavobacterium pectinovorum TaxID=29533 RepID=A0A502EGC9_9FLAO|nr:hypothetical protein [Flavobacterium pectinovorum]TPG35560.1 hypothetical protein EAH81_20705 [Flavobacterium pectinovorum]